jgi:hypothetical protein
VVLELALRHVAAALEQLKRSGREDDLPRAWLVEVDVRDALGELQACGDLLTHTLTVARRNELALCEVDGLLWSARRHLALHDRPAAVRDLERARAIVVRTGYQRCRAELRELESSASS